MWKKIAEVFGDRENYRKYFCWLFRVSKPYIKSILFIVLVRCIISVLGIVSATINKYIVDFAASEFQRRAYIIAAAACLLLSIAGNIVLSIVSLSVTERYSCHIRSKMFEHILNSTWIERRKRHSEEFMTRLTADISAVTGGVINISSSVISTVIQFVMAFSILWYYDKSLAMVGILTGPVIGIVGVAIGQRIKDIQKKIQENESEYRVFLQERISHASTVKVFSQENISVEKLSEIHNRRMHWIKKKNIIKLYSSALVHLIFSGTYLFAFCVGAIKVSTGAITFGTMTVFLSLIGQVQTPLYSLMHILPQTFGLLASAGRVMEISEMPLEEENENICLDGALGLKVENVALSYEDKRVIENLDIDIKPAEFIMLKGASGIGKTTLIRNILGFLRPDSGRIVLYNESKEVECSASTRNYITYVPQGNTLFGDTIEENLRMAKPDATEDEMFDALQSACAMDFVSKLDDGLKSVVGEKGCGLSEGQAQRIAIARAVLKPAGLIIMDEATSALDARTEQEILKNLKQNLGGKTCLFVSHRESVKEYADRVVEIGNTNY